MLPGSRYTSYKLSDQQSHHQAPDWHCAGQREEGITELLYLQNVSPGLLMGLALYTSLFHRQHLQRHCHPTVIVGSPYDHDLLLTWGLNCSGSHSLGTIKNTRLWAPALEMVCLPWALATVILKQLPLGFDAQWGCTCLPLSVTPPECSPGLPLVSQTLM